ncbi:CU044_2847 family protein [Streptomyces sp. NPDC049040]|uniref:CU044_2847 family protein n=1 Tax=Streptomyces sp. NPDC049040 TaxID=3365593 RepID=UPI00371144A9
MAEMVAFTIGDGAAQVFVDVADDEDGVQRVSRGGDAIRTASATFEAGFGHVRDAAAHALAQLTALPQRPSTVELEFGVRISAAAGAVFAKTGADGHLKVRMVWEGHPQAAAEEAGDTEDSGD